MRKQKFGILLYFYAFLVIYNPSFFKNVNGYFDYSLAFIYWLIGVVYLKSTKKKSFTKIYLQKNDITYYIFVYGIIAMLLFFIRSIIAGTSITDLVHLRIVQSIYVIIIIFSINNIVLHFKSLGVTGEEQVLFLLNVCMIQFVFVIIMVLFPQIRMSILNVIYITDKRDFTFTLAKRVYGIMSNYTFSGSIFHGMMAFVALCFGYYKNKKFYKYIPFLLLMVFLNARIGFIIFLEGTIVFIGYNLLFGNNIGKISKLLMSMTIIGALACIILPIFWPDTFRFFASGFSEMFSYAKTGVASEIESRSDIDKLSKQFMTNINLKTFLFGNGYRIQNPGDIPQGVSFNGVWSDMGLLNDMYMGGIVYMFLLCSPFYRLFIKYKSSQMEGIINIAFIAFLITACIKGELYRSPILLGTMVYLKQSLQEKEVKDDGQSICNNVNL